MIKLSIPQAKAIARKIINRINEINKENYNVIFNEIYNSEECKAYRKQITKIVNEAIKLHVDFSDTYGSFYINGSSVTISCLNENKKDKIDEFVRGWVRYQAGDKINRIPIKSESDLVDDIILDALEADDVNAIINKYVN